MKKSIFVTIMAMIVISCQNSKKQNSDPKLNEYVLTIYQDKYDFEKRTFSQDNTVSTVQSVNDTTAYLLALNTFYNDKVKQRALSNYGQPKNFLIVDKNKIDLSLKLSKRMVEGLQLQVKSTPDVKKMLEDYDKDSLTVL